MRQIKMGAISYGKMCALMCEGIYSCAEIADMIGLHYTTVLHYTRELHRAGAAHITAWETDVRGRQCVRIYKLGEGVNVKPKKAKTTAQRQETARSKRAHLDLIQRMAA